MSSWFVLFLLTNLCRQGQLGDVDVRTRRRPHGQADRMSDRLSAETVRRHAAVLETIARRPADVRVPLLSVRQLRNRHRGPVSGDVASSYAGNKPRGSGLHRWKTRAWKMGRPTSRHDTDNVDATVELQNCSLLDVVLRKLATCALPCGFIHCPDISFCAFFLHEFTQFSLFCLLNKFSKRLFTGCHEYPCLIKHYCQQSAVGHQCRSTLCNFVIWCRMIW